MKLFVITGNAVEPTPEVLTIPEFKKIWDKDKTKTKTKARGTFSYIYHLVDPKSLYINYRDRSYQCKEDFIPTANITIDIEQAVAKYKALITTPEERLLNAAFTACDKLALYLEAVDFNERDERGNLTHDPHKLINSLKSVKVVISQLKELRVLMEKGQDEKEQNRGGHELNMFDQRL
jgi:hypothetical protein